MGVSAQSRRSCSGLHPAIRSGLPETSDERDREWVVGIASPRTIGIAVVVAIAGGLVPGVPGLVGGAPVEDTAAALPPARKPEA